MPTLRRNCRGRSIRASRFCGALLRKDASLLIDSEQLHAVYWKEVN